MSLSAFSSRPLLPLFDRGYFDKTPDWVSLWEEWATQGPAVLLESAGFADEANRWQILAGYPEIEFFERDGKFQSSTGSEMELDSMDVFSFLNKIGSNLSDYLPAPFSFSQAWFGILSYEFGKTGVLSGGKRKQTGNRSVPDFYFFKPGRVVAYDRNSKEYFRFGTGFGDQDWKGKQNSGPFNVGSIRPQMTFEDYQRMVQKAKSYIADGDIYQANLAQSFQTQWNGNVGSLYRTLREINPGPFMGIFKAGDFTVVSSSPERLVSGQGDWIETRPIAGTRPRGKDAVEDLQFLWELKTNPKEQAEHLMLVDLARNDLGKIARYGTVEVSRYADVESYSKVHHLVSRVKARRKSSISVAEVLKSLFPGGTITGCPKIRCMEIIEELEARPRGFYTGSMGYVAPGPCFDFNILIRSFTLLSNGILDFYAGAGIVADSDPEREYMETLHKVEALAQALGTSFLKKT
jgi:anthranilate/para-aminobenzoate synthase component I